MIRDLAIYTFVVLVGAAVFLLAVLALTAGLTAIGGA